MSEAKTGTYDVRACRSVAAGARHAASSMAEKHAQGRADHSAKADSMPRGGIRHFPGWATARQVREESEVYIPDILSLEHYQHDPEHDEAAAEHAKHLYRAQRHLDEAYNLVRVLTSSLEDDGDSRATQADIVLRLVEKKLDKANNGIDRHARRHKNLFLAYCDLWERAGQERREQ